MSGKPYTPSHIDEHIGHRMQLRRIMLGMSQKDLAKICGVTFQQIQKYECGANRLSAARLWELAEALQTPISYFYDGLDTPSAQLQTSPSQDHPRLVSAA